MMKYSVVFLIVAALPLCNLLQGQTLDSLYLSSTQLSPGDTATIELSLKNHSFSVGGFRLAIAIADSGRAHFASVSRGADVQYFSYYNVSDFSSGTIRITGIANMPFAPANPLPLGLHQLAIIKVAVSDTISPPRSIPVIFKSLDSLSNVISDSSGYFIVQPISADGLIMVSWPNSISGDEVIPMQFELGDNYPNPFNSQTIIEYSLTDPGHVILDIYDILGSRVAILANGYRTPGHYSVIWDGKSASGGTLSSGTYLYSLKINGQSITKKLSMVK